VTLPQQYLLTPDAAQGLRAFVQDGGTLVMGPYSGVVDGDDHVVPGGYPGLLQDVLGAWVEEWAPLQTAETREVRWADGRVTPVHEWTEVLHADGAEVLATYEADFIAGQPAVTRHAFGQGHAYYLSTRPDAAALTDLLRGALHGAGVATADLPDGLDVTLSDTADGRLLHLIHFGAQDVTVQVAHATDAVSAEARGTLTLRPLDAALLRVPAGFELRDLTVLPAAGTPA
jgi:beta-galactosidase